MKKILFILLAVSCFSCNGGMTNDEIISEVNKCKKAGLRSRYVQNGLTYEITNIQCIPENEK